MVTLDMHVITMDFAARLAAALIQRGRTQQPLAEHGGVYGTQIPRYEAGAIAPTLDCAAAWR